MPNPVSSSRVSLRRRGSVATRGGWMKVVRLRLSISGRALCSVSILFALLLCVSAAAIAQDTRIEIARRAFAMLDDNGDGKVTFEEFQGKKILAFTARDKNQDNRLSR